MTFIYVLKLFPLFSFSKNKNKKLQPIMLIFKSHHTDVCVAKTIVFVITLIVKERQVALGIWCHMLNDIV